jgi:hypothetical protein
VKHEMGHVLDTWLEEEDNMNKWIGEGENAMKMWEKRVLITHLLAEAWEKVCSTFDFEKAATRIGMRMTVDGSGDSEISIQGVENYSFCDADGGEDGIDRGADPEEEALLATEVEKGGDDGDSGNDYADSDNDNAQSDDDEGEEGYESEDDTAERLADKVGALEDPPTGYEFVDEVPALETEADFKKLIGQHIMHAWATEHIFGWYMGTVTHFGCSTRDQRETLSANMVVQYKKSVTKNNKLDGRVASTLTADRYGKGDWWVLLKQFTE